MNYEFMITGTHLPPCMPLPRATLRLPVSNTAKVMKKLEKLAEKYPEQIIKKDANNFIVPKRCVSVREPYSEKRRKAASERARAAGYKPL